MKPAAPLLPTTLIGSLLLGACTPTVRVEAPEKPIEINLNVRIEQEVRVKLDHELDSAFRDNPDLFGTPAAKEKRP
ncbi:YnbE family lipoprotein [Plasticicumulans acidivorans]|uniref:YnbE-like lipoprotein n=1 Tax=Plasticicumulans acidivorans TaxID=886464 RepID=A0A317MVZ7_9GAMM|nr:YnbE family lipoprotein [Plasticicumulans acidivorans]PWV62485.1 YnbE-like lipoprotein [Plasticicumulans acidivorans]